MREVRDRLGLAHLAVLFDVQQCEPLEYSDAYVPTKYGINFTAKFMNQGGALVHVYTDGTILISHGGTEMGQGLHTKVAQIAARAGRADRCVMFCVCLLRRACVCALGGSVGFRVCSVVFAVCACGAWVVSTGAKRFSAN